MKHALLSLVAVGVASIAAIAATSTFLNMPHRIGPETPTTQTPASQPAPSPDSKPATGEGSTPATPGSAPGPSAPAGAPAAPAAGGAADTKPADEEADKDPYEGIAPEELPPDLQYNADSSVSFPTNI
jgi:hypothetical protein